MPDEVLIKIPIYEEILVSSFELNALVSSLQNKRVGMVPCYLNLGELKGKQLHEAINNIIKALKKNEISPFFPYPLYLITEHVQYHPDIQIAPSVEQLPRHYFRKSRRLNPKENALLNRNNITAAKIFNENIDQKLSQLKALSSENQEMYNLTTECFFYQQLNQLLAKNSQDQELEDG